MKDVLSRAIPKIGVPSITSRVEEFVNEPIVSLSEEGFLVDSQYYKQGIPGSYKDCYVRKSLVEMLHNAESMLPDGLRFLIYDGYRPICIQQRLWNHYRGTIKHDNPNLSDEELDFKTSFFVSKPSYDESMPSLHNTGGAIDLTLYDKSGKVLNMGTEFDDFSDKAWSNHFEEYEDNEVVRNNRRILYNVMIEAGFTNLPSEWWHYDFGDKFWAHFKGKKPVYIGILDIDFPNRFPLN